MGNRSDLLDLEALNVDSNGVGGITAAEVREVLEGIINLTVVKDEAGDLGSALEWSTSTINVKALGISTAMIADAAVTLAKQANLAQSTIVGRAAAAGTGVPTALTATQVKTLLAIAAGDVSGLAAIATSGSASDLGTGTLPIARIADAAVTLAKLADLAQSTILGRAAAAGTGVPTALTATQVKTILAIAESDVTDLVTDLAAKELLANKDTDGTLAANSDTKYASQKAVKTYVDASFAANDAMIFKGVIDASGNPNYPAADKGHTYKISVAGKIGGASGTNVEVGDMIIAIADGLSAGTQAAVGASWSVIQTNLDGAVIGPASVTDGNPAVFDGTSGKLIKQVTFASFKTSLSLATVATSGDAADLTGTLAAARIAAGSLALTKLATQADATILGNNTGGASSPVALTAAQTKTLLAIAAGDVSGLAAVATSGSASDLGTGTLPIARIAAGAVTLAKIATQADSTILGNNTGGAASPVALTVAQTKTLLAIASADISDLLSGTKAWTAAHTWTTSGTGTMMSLVSTAALSSTIGPAFVIRKEGGGTGVIGTNDYTALSTTAVSRIAVRMIGDFLDDTNAAEDGQWRLQVMTAGTRATQITANDGVLIGAATGGAQGVGTLNATTLYEGGATLASVYAALASPALTGNPTAPTQALGNNSTRLATTAFIERLVGYDSGAAASTLKGYDGSGVLTGNLNLSSGSMQWAPVSAVPSMSFLSPTSSAGASIGSWSFTAPNSTPANRSFVVFDAVSDVKTAGNEEGRLTIKTYNAGTLATRLNIANGIYTSGVTGGDKGAGTFNADALYQAGTALGALAFKNTIDASSLVDANALTLSDLPQITDQRLLGNTSGGTANVASQTPAAVMTMLDASFADLYKVLAADDAGGNNNSAQPVFPASGAVAVEAGTYYFFEGLYMITRSAGNTSHTTSVLFGGTATLTNIGFMVQAKTSTGAALTAMSGHHFVTAAGGVVTAASTSTTENLLIYVRGSVKINVAGTFIPQFQYSVAPGGAPTILKNTFFSMTKQGTTATHGTWS